MYTYDRGQTPIDDDEKIGLKIFSISTMEELNEFEQNNIEKAIQWSLSRNFKKETILSESFIKKLHFKMFGDVWEWAGEFRKTNKNIGVDKSIISVQLRDLLDDAFYWLNHKSFDEDEFAIRVKHRIVSIHLFPNGNGRHSRLFADIIVSHIFKKQPFSWGSNSDIYPSSTGRIRYMEALRDADNGNYQRLLEFARS